MTNDNNICDDDNYDVVLKVKTSNNNLMKIIKICSILIALMIIAVQIYLVLNFFRTSEKVDKFTLTVNEKVDANLSLVKELKSNISDNINHNIKTEERGLYLDQYPDLSMVERVTYSSSELFDGLIDAIGNKFWDKELTSIHFLDSAYTVLDMNTTKNMLKFMNAIVKYKAEVYDCDNFSWDTKTHNSKVSELNNFEYSHATAIFNFYYKVKGNPKWFGHSVNLVAIKGDDPYTEDKIERWTYYVVEPQTLVDSSLYDRNLILSDIKLSQINEKVELGELCQTEKIRMNYAIVSSLKQFLESYIDLGLANTIKVGLIVQ